MKNRKSILYINIFVILFAIITVFLKFTENQYFILISLALAILSIAFLLVAVLMLFSEKENNNKQKIEDKEKLSSIEIKEENLLYKVNKYKELILKIDLSQTQENILERKIQFLADEINLVAGLYYWVNNNNLELKSTFALVKEEHKNLIEIGSGLTGQVAKNGQYIKIQDLDKINIEIVSGLGMAKPKNMYILPVFRKEKVIAVVELVTFSEITNDNINSLIEVLSSNE